MVASIRCAMSVCRRSQLPVSRRRSLLGDVALTLALLFASLQTAAKVQPDVAFYYGTTPPVSALAAYDWVVLDAENAKLATAQADTNGTITLAEQTTLFCYLSIGEAREDQLDDRLAALAIGSNTAWNSTIMDVRSTGWHEALLVAGEALLARGCEGFFLDTMDSYQLALDEADWPTAERGLARIVAALAALPDKPALLMNRGFEILDRVAPMLSGIVVESLFRGYQASQQDEANGGYVTVPAHERRWVLEQLDRVKDKGLPAVVIDYLPPSHSDEEALNLAQEIRALGYSAWVTDASLVHLGVSRAAHVPRRIKVLYYGDRADFAAQDAHLLLGAPLDYLGYVVEAHDLRDGLPELIRGVHAGAVTWYAGGAEDTWLTSEDWEQWLLSAKAEGFPVAMFGRLPTISDSLLDAIGFTAKATGVSERLPILEAQPGVGDFEARLQPTSRVAHWLSSESPANALWLTLGDRDDQYAAVATGAWGGFVLDPFLIQEGYKGQRRWVVDPFQFLRQAFGTPVAPIPDTTTENGNRILLSWVDGDAFPSRAEVPGTPYSAEVLLDLYREIDLPHTVSVIEGEVGKKGLYPWLSKELEAIARETFALPNVEVASHSYSHPFFWARRDKIKVEKTLYGLGLPIRNYTMNLEREIAGSADYTDSLAPPGKPTKVFLWTGDAVPSAEAVRTVARRKLVNMNGGNTTMRTAFPSVTNVYGQSRPTNGGYQVYAPVMNENVYTNDWTGPFYGFRKVIETFELTDAPRRLKPMAIYYHYYSGTKQSALNALYEIYDYVLAQPSTPLFVSEFSKRVTSYHDVELTHALDGTWSLTSLGDLRTLRIDSSLGWPDLGKSRNVAGFSEGPDGRYVHLSAAEANLRFMDQRPAETHLVSANGKLHYWRPAADGIELRIEAHVPLKVAIRSEGSCALKIGVDSRQPNERSGTLQTFTLVTRDTGDALLVCR